MRGTIAMLVTALLLGIGAVFFTAPPASAEPYCRVKSAKMYFNHADGTVDAIGHYRSCANGREAWVKPLSGVGRYNFDGEHMSCNSIMRKYDGVRVNFYFWETDGWRVHNPASFVIPCDESTRNGKVQNWDAKRLYFGPSWPAWGAPKMKVSVTVMYNFRDDKHLSNSLSLKLPF